ncbi:MAG: hypothetical protein ACFB9N_10450 [Geitlerinemataceae cyanobacterium]
MYPIFKAALLSSIATLSLATTATAQGFLPDGGFFDTGQDRFEEQIDALQQSQQGSVLTIDGDTQQWQPLISESGEFSVWMPVGIFTSRSQQIEAEGLAIAFEIFSSQTETQKFAIAHADRPNADDDRIFATVRDALATETGLFVTNIEPSADGNNPSETIALADDTTSIIIRTVLTDDRVYVLAVDRATGSPIDATTTFFESFAIEAD